MKRFRLVFVALLGLSMSAPSFAQPGPGMGEGVSPGMRQGMGPGMGPGMSNGAGPGMGNGMYGWNLLTPEERTAFQQKMHSVKTIDECRSVMADHRKLVEERAKEKNVTLRTPRRNPCDRMKERGMIQ